MRDSRKRKKIVKASRQPYITFRDLWYHKCIRNVFMASIHIALFVAEL